MTATEEALVHCDFVNYRDGLNEIVVGGAIDRVLFAEEVEKAGDTSIVEPIGDVAIHGAALESNTD